MFELSDNIQQIAVYPAPERCSTFQHSVRSATIRAVSFIEKFYKLDSFIRVPPVNGSCTSYTSFLKTQLDSCLIASMDGKFPQGVSKTDHLSFSASISSVQKSWPKSCDCMNDDLEVSLRNRLTKEKIRLPAGYLEFVNEKVLEIFPKGMRGHDLSLHAKRVTPPYSSTTSSSRKEGGSYSSWRNCREDYFNSLEKPEVVHRPCYMVAATPGKPRPLVKNHHSYLTLRPFHTFMYDRLSKQPWLLRGPPSLKRFESAGFSKGRNYLSADFSAATDNIPIEVAEQIIDTIASRSSLSIMPLLSEVRRSLRPTITMPSGEVSPTTGQLMGNLCSFPLLCLQNYIASEWVDRLAGFKAPKLINGDDLVAEAPQSWVDIYRQEAPKLGFTLNEKKTSYSTMPNINSTYFTSNFKEIPFVRAKGLNMYDPRTIGKVINDIKRPFERTRHSRLPRLQNHLVYFFSRHIRKFGLTLFNLGFRVRTDRNLVLDRKTKHYEKYRSGHTHKLQLSPLNPMGLQLTQVNDEFNIHEDSEVAEAIVNEHWNGPKFESVKESVWDVRKQLMKDKKIYGVRWKKLGMKATMLRLVREPKKEKLVWIPARLADCYSLSHDRSYIEHTPDSSELPFIGFVKCNICERIERILKERRELSRPADWRLDIPFKFTATVADVTTERNRDEVRIAAVVTEMYRQRSVL
jgi:hypothetical protein